MQKLLSLPPNLIDSFHQLEEVNHTDWFCTSDPVGSKLGSGGGTTWLLQACHQAFAPEETFSKWIGNEKKILLHAGGQSRRLPGYAPSGKILTPIPVFSWERGQKLGQNLLSLQLPLYERIMKQAPKGLNTLIAAETYISVRKTAARHPGSRCRMLWFMGESFIGYSPRSIRIGPQEAGSARLHVAETFFRGIGRIIKDPSFPDGYRYMDIK